MVGQTRFLKCCTTEIGNLYSPIPGNTDLYALDTDYGLNGSAAEIIEAAADLDGNGKINNRDLGLLQKKLNN